MQQLQYENRETLCRMKPYGAEEVSMWVRDEGEDLKAERVRDMLSHPSAGVGLLQPSGSASASAGEDDRPRTARRNDRTDDDTDECVRGQKHRAAFFKSPHHDGYLHAYTLSCSV